MKNAISCWQPAADRRLRRGQGRGAHLRGHLGAEPARMAAADGCELIVVPNASPYHIGKRELREQALRQRTRETGCPVVYANVIGGQDELVFDGRSFAMTVPR